ASSTPTTAATGTTRATNRASNRPGTGARVAAEAWARDTARPRIARSNAMTKGPVRLDVAVSYAVPRAGVPAAQSFRRWVAAALAGRIGEADAPIRVADAPEGEALSRHYRGKDYATNVLSFPAEMPEGLPKGIKFPLLGDLVICAPV